MSRFHPLGAEYPSVLRLMSYFVFNCLSAGTELFSNHGLSQYVDPSNYGDPMDALKTFATEIDRNKIKLEKNVGGGVFQKMFDHIFLKSIACLDNFLFG